VILFSFIENIANCISTERNRHASDGYSLRVVVWIHFRSWIDHFRDIFFNPIEDTLFKEITAKSFAFFMAAGVFHFTLQRVYLFLVDFLKIRWRCRWRWWLAEIECIHFITLFSIFIRILRISNKTCLKSICGSIMICGNRIGFLRGF